MKYRTIAVKVWVCFLIMAVLSSCSLSEDSFEEKTVIPPNTQRVSIPGKTPTPAMSEQKMNEGDWIVARMPDKANLYDAIWNGQMFVAVGEYGTILTSMDGLKWQKQDSGIKNDTIQCIAWNGSRFAAGVSGGIQGKHYIITSEDGVQWTKRYETEDGGNNWFLSITSDGNGVFVAVASNSGSMVRNDGWLYYSPDGIEWEVKAASYDLHQYTQGNSKKIPYKGRYYSVTWCEDRFVCMGDSSLLVSEDGNTWKEVQFGQTVYIGASDGMTLVTANNPNSSLVTYDILQSSSWSDGTIVRGSTTVRATDHGMPSTGNLYQCSHEELDKDHNPNSRLEKIEIEDAFEPIQKIIYAEGVFLALGKSGYVLQSKDGSNWKVQHVPVPYVALAIASNGKRHIILGDDGYILASAIVGD